ncbi:MAG: GxxExxY protein [Sphingobacteriales bacterium]|nr:GxxExxY protein [Sphingobacteriales bacterium]
MVNNTIILELKAIDILHPIHETQLVNYLNATQIDIGLLINFGRSVEVKRKFRLYTKTKI